MNNVLKLFKTNCDETELDLLEQVYKKVKVGSHVKLNGKSYKRLPPKNNKIYKYPYHFILYNENLYRGMVMSIDYWGDRVSNVCDYMAIIEEVDNQ